MALSFIGVLVCAGILLMGRWLGAPLLIGLFASLPFGSTAFATLSALGGSSPLIYTLFALALIVSMFARRAGISDIGKVLSTHPSAWVLIGLVFYAVGSALILPRLFEGQTTAFTVYRGGIREILLTPTSGNVTQGGYFILDSLIFFVFATLMLKRDNLRLVRSGFFTFVGVNVALGAIDLVGKIALHGDILFSIRTASYSLLTEVAEVGFWRIVGGYAEASSFAIMTVACFAFCFVYWRGTGSRVAMAFAVASFIFALLSTSSTGYVALTLLTALYCCLATKPLLSGRLHTRDLLIAFCAMILFAIGLVLYLASERLFDPVIVLFDTMITNKAQSQSGLERAYWNQRSMAALVETQGFGIGLGSSRASSWLVAVASQFGVVGGLLMAILVVALLRGPGSSRLATADPEAFVLCRAARAFAFAFLIGASISGGAANPGILFFICLAVVVSLRKSIHSAAARGASCAAKRD